MFSIRSNKTSASIDALKILLRDVVLKQKRERPSKVGDERKPFAEKLPEICYCPCSKIALQKETKVQLRLLIFTSRECVESDDCSQP